MPASWYYCPIKLRFIDRICRNIQVQKMRKVVLSAFLHDIVCLLFLLGTENRIHNEPAYFSFQPLFGHGYSCFSAYFLFDGSYSNSPFQGKT